MHSAHPPMDGAQRSTGRCHWPNGPCHRSNALRQPWNRQVQRRGSRTVLGAFG
ncbi:hypothetical protein ACFOLD_02625 [Kocuria carniphila]|uniref:hypothetical protein n=1 Tax=Kocuria carniphila TaxID=262208 RepID=UPI003622F58E